MATPTVIIARATTDGFQGRLIPGDGDPTDRIHLLRAAYRDAFDSDLAATTAHFIDDQHDGTPLVTDTNAHSTGAQWLLLLEDSGVAVFKADHIGGTRTWTWTGKEAWNADSTRAFSTANH